MAGLRSLVRPFARLLHTSAPRLQQQQNAAQDAAGELKTIVEETIRENYPTPRSASAKISSSCNKTEEHIIYSIHNPIHYQIRKILGLCSLQTP